MRSTRRSFVPRFLAGLLAVTALAGCGASGNAGAELTGVPSDAATSSPEPTGAASSPENPMSSNPSKPTPSLPADPADAGTAMLTISIRMTPESQPTEYFLECTRDGIGETTTVPNPEAACEAVKRLGAAFFNAQPDPNQMCTQQYGGPQTATVKGTVDGHRVYATFSATDGCQIARWNALEAILGSAGAS